MTEPKEEKALVTSNEPNTAADKDAGKPDSTHSIEELLSSQMKRILLAGVGAVVLAQEEFEQMIRKLVQRGELAEQEARKMLKDFVEKRYRQTKDTVHNIESRLESLDTLLGKFSIPTKSQFEELSRKVDVLSSRIEDLSKKIEQK